MNKALNKIRKLVVFAHAGKAHENERAAELAASIAAAHGINRRSIEVVTEYLDDKSEFWCEQLAVAVAGYNHCRVIKRNGLAARGLRLDVEATRSMYLTLATEVHMTAALAFRRLYYDTPIGALAAPFWLRAFRYGAIAEIAERLAPPLPKNQRASVAAGDRPATNIEIDRMIEEANRFIERFDAIIGSRAADVAVARQRQAEYAGERAFRKVRQRLRKPQLALPPATVRTIRLIAAESSFLPRQMRYDLDVREVVEIKSVPVRRIEL